jgi:uracil-DNA glycosylase
LTRVIVALGSVAFTAVLKVLRERDFAFERTAFAHGAELRARSWPRSIVVIASYHPSRQNTNTGKLTVPMFDAIFMRANQLLGQKQARPSKPAERLDR